MTPDEILRLPPDEELVFIRGENVFRARRFDYSLHTHYKKLRKTKSIFHEPAWKRNANKQALSYTKAAIYNPQVAKKKPTAAIPTQEPEPTPEQTAAAALGLRPTQVSEIMKKGS